MIISRIIRSYNRTLLSPSSRKEKKKSTPKKFLIFQGMETSGSILRNFLIFLKGKLCLYFVKRRLFIFQEKETSKKFLIRNIFIFKETETLKNFLYFRNFPEHSSSKNGKNPVLKNLLYFLK